MTINSPNLTHCSAGVLTIRDSVIVGSHATHFSRDTPTPEACGSASLLPGSSTGALGGALAVRNGQATISGTQLLHCSGTCHGGAIACEGPRSSIAFNDGSRVTDALATLGNGGAVYAAGGCQLRVTSCAIQSSGARSLGGALYLGGAATTAVLDDLTVDECSSGAGGSDTAAHGGAVAVGDYTTQVSISDSVFSRCSSATGGGLALLQGASVAITNSSITDCVASLRGGGISAGGASFRASRVTLNANNAVDGTALYMGRSVIPAIIHQPHFKL